MIMAYTPQQRALLFWGVCIPLRSYLALLARDGRYSLQLRAFAAVIGVRWLTGLENGDEGALGGPTWWKEERKLHGALWTVYAATDRWQFLAADTLFGALNWMSYLLPAPPRSSTIAP